MSKEQQAVIRQELQDVFDCLHIDFSEVELTKGIEEWEV